MNPSAQISDISTSVEEALHFWKHGVACSTDERFSDEINHRLQEAKDNAQGAVSSVGVAERENIKRLLNVAIAAPSKSKQVQWLHRAADVATEAYGPASACRPGCSHCCHIPVKISFAEARSIGKAIGRAPIPKDQHRSIEISGYALPCPFLDGGKCSIYKERPAVCRTHLNMDVDDLLCRLVPGQDIPVPYYDARAFVMASVMIEQDITQWADVRQWFGRA